MSPSPTPEKPVEQERKAALAAGGVSKAPAGPVEDVESLALGEALRSSFRIVKWLMIGLVVIFIASGIFTVQPNEVAVVLRFGRPVGVGSEQLLPPGLHFALPYPVDEIVRIPVGESHTVVSTAGWYPITPEMEAAGQAPEVMPSMRPGVDGYTLTADGNILHARATLKYRIQPTAALAYAFHFAHPTNLLQKVLDNALFYASCRFRADEAIYRDKLAFTEQVRERVNHQIARVALGVTIDTLDVETTAPLSVRPAFDEVLNAQQVARTKMNEAESYARGATNTALGQASVILSDGLTRSNELVKTVAAWTHSFREQLPYYQSDPVLFQQRLLVESMQRVLTNAQEKFFVPRRADGQPRELRLQLNREPLKMTNQP